MRFFPLHKCTVLVAIVLSLSVLVSFKGVSPAQASTDIIKYYRFGNQESPRGHYSLQDTKEIFDKAALTWSENTKTGVDFISQPFAITTEMYFENNSGIRLLSPILPLIAQTFRRRSTPSCQYTIVNTGSYHDCINAIDKYEGQYSDQIVAHFTYYFGSLGYNMPYGLLTNRYYSLHGTPVGMNGHANLSTFVPVYNDNVNYQNAINNLYVRGIKILEIEGIGASKEYEQYGLLRENYKRDIGAYISLRDISTTYTPQAVYIGMMKLIGHALGKEYDKYYQVDPVYYGSVSTITQVASRGFVNFGSIRPIGWGQQNSTTTTSAPIPAQNSSIQSIVFHQPESSTLIATIRGQNLPTDLEWIETQMPHVCSSTDPHNWGNPNEKSIRCTLIPGSSGSHEGVITSQSQPQLETRFSFTIALLPVQNTPPPMANPNTYITTISTEQIENTIIATIRGHNLPTDLEWREDQTPYACSSTDPHNWANPDEKSIRCTIVPGTRGAHNGIIASTSETHLATRFTYEVGDPANFPIPVSPMTVISVGPSRRYTNETSRLYFTGTNIRPESYLEVSGGNCTPLATSIGNPSIREYDCMFTGTGGRNILVYEYPGAPHPIGHAYIDILERQVVVPRPVPTPIFSIHDYHDALESQVIDIEETGRFTIWGRYLGSLQIDIVPATACTNLLDISPQNVESIRTWTCDPQILGTFTARISAPTVNQFPILTRTIQIVEPLPHLDQVPTQYLMPGTISYMAITGTNINNMNLQIYEQYCNGISNNSWLEVPSIGSSTIRVFSCSPHMPVALGSYNFPATIYQIGTNNQRTELQTFQTEISGYSGTYGTPPTRLDRITKPSKTYIGEPFVLVAHGVNLQSVKLELEHCSGPRQTGEGILTCTPNTPGIVHGRITDATGQTTLNQFQTEFVVKPTYSNGVTQIASFNTSPAPTQGTSTTITWDIGGGTTFPVQSISSGFCTEDSPAQVINSQISWSCTPQRSGLVGIQLRTTDNRSYIFYMDVTAHTPIINSVSPQTAFFNTPFNLTIEGTFLRNMILRVENMQDLIITPQNENSATYQLSIPTGSSVRSIQLIDQSTNQIVHTTQITVTEYPRPSYTEIQVENALFQNSQSVFALRGSNLGGIKFEIVGCFNQSQQGNSLRLIDAYGIGTTGAEEIRISCTPIPLLGNILILKIYNLTQTPIYYREILITNTPLNTTYLLEIPY